MPATQPGPSEHWYRNPWVWLVISIPSLTVLGCLLTIYLALANPDYLVRDMGTPPRTTEQRLSQ